MQNVIQIKNRVDYRTQFPVRSCTEVWFSLHWLLRSPQLLKRGLGASSIQNVIQIKNNVDYRTKFPVRSCTETWFSLHWLLRSPQSLTDIVRKTSLKKFTHVVQEIRTVRVDNVGPIAQSV